MSFAYSSAIWNTRFRRYFYPKWGDQLRPDADQADVSSAKGSRGLRPSAGRCWRARELLQQGTELVRAL